MNRTSLASYALELEDLIAELIDQANSHQGIENRVEPRFPLTCPVKVYFRTLDQRHEAFSRDISSTGIGLITDVEISSGQRAELSIDRLNGTSMKMDATCRWCTGYGPNLFLSGFEFLRLTGIRRF